MTTNSPKPVDGDVQAQPVAWAHRLVNKLNGTVHPWVYGSNEKEPSEGDIFRIEAMPLYAARPAQFLRPVELPDCELGAVSIMSGGNKDYCNGFVDGTNNAIKAIREAGYEVKS